LLHAAVHPADIQDRDGGELVLSSLVAMYPFLLTLFGDAGYQGSKFRQAAARFLPQLQIEIVKRSDLLKGFVVMPKRWVVERTFAWLGRGRRPVSLCRLKGSASPSVQAAGPALIKLLK
jgi:transposase